MNGLTAFVTKFWPSVALVCVFLAGAGAIVVAMLTDHSEQVTPIITWATIVVVGLGALFKLDRNSADVAQKIEDAKSEVVGKQANTEIKIDAAKRTAEVAANKVEKARQETVGMLSDQNEVLGEIRKQTNGEGPIAELARKVDTVIETVAGHGEILRKLSEKGKP